MVTSVFDILTLVALLAEGVDRNLQKAHLVGPLCRVALLAEGVDRNSDFVIVLTAGTASPSSRRAWIEIQISSFPQLSALRRPPRGGRG